MLPTRSRLKLILAGISTALTLALAGTVAADAPLKLRTHDIEVDGTREVEAGSYQAGIAKLEAALEQKVSLQNKEAILNNLCVAYIAIEDFGNAEYYCDQAVLHSKRGLAYNNRGVLKVATGQLVDGIRDFHMAKAVGFSHGTAKANLAQLEQ